MRLQSPAAALPRVRHFPGAKLAGARAPPGGARVAASDPFPGLRTARAGCERLPAVGAFDADSAPQRAGSRRFGHRPGGHQRRGESAISP